MAQTFYLRATAESGLVSSGQGSGRGLRRRRDTGFYYNLLSGAYEAYVTANINGYSISSSGEGNTGQYIMLDPTPTVEGDFIFVKQSGSTLAEYDLANGMRWQDNAGPDSADLEYLLTNYLGSGTIATLNLSKLNVVNNSGDAIFAQSLYSGGNGINAQGFGPGNGIYAIGGNAPDGDGFHIVGGGSSGSFGFRILGGLSGGDGIYAIAQGGIGNGMTLVHAGAGFDLNAATTPPMLVGMMSGQLSGQAVNILSGNSVSVWSGTSYLASGSIFMLTFASGVVGGGSGNLPSAWGASGAVVIGKDMDKSGMTLSASGMDTITIEAGMNMRQAMSIVSAANAGRFSGAGTTTVLIDGANASGTNRITATVNQSGDRSVVSLNLPT